MQTSLDQTYQGAEENDKPWMAFAVSFVLSLLLRLLFLGEKVMHHDESLHAFYAAQIVAGYAHEYSAMLHGPFIYYIGAFFQLLFGDSDFVARLPTALFGSLVAATVWLVPATTLHRSQKLFLSTVWAISPYFLYFSRFLRSDIFVVFSLLLLAAACLCGRKAWGTWAPIAAGAAVGISFSSKENSFLHLLLGLCCLASGALFSGAFRKKLKEMWSAKNLLLATGTAAVVFVLFYTSFFRHPKGPLEGLVDGLYRESLGYWWRENQAQRVAGAFDYHFPILTHYESYLIPLLIWRFIKDSSFLLQKTLKSSAALTPWLSALLLLLPTLLLIFFPLVALEESLSPGTTAFLRLLHLSHLHHLGQVLMLLLLGGLAYLSCLRQENHVLATTWFFFVGSVGAYSYVGEKVPWLGIYIVFFASWLACFTIREVFQSRSFAARSVAITSGLLGVLSVQKSLRLSFFRPADPAERLVYTHTSPEVLEVLSTLTAAHQRAQTEGNSLNVLFRGDPVWPFAWYARTQLKHATPSFSTETPSSEVKEDLLVFGNSELAELKPRLEESHFISKHSLRAWWVPDPQPTAKQVLSYFFWGEPFEPSEPGLIDGVKSFGYTSFYLATRKEICAAPQSRQDNCP